MSELIVHLVWSINYPTALQEKEVLLVQWLSALEMNMATRVLIQDEAVCISDSANPHEKGMTLTIFFPSMEVPVV